MARTVGRRARWPRNRRLSLKGNLLMTTLKTVASFDHPVDAERAIETLVTAGIDPAVIEVVVGDGDTPVAAPEAGAVTLSVTAPEEDTMMVEDILRDSGEIDLAASDTPAVGWAGDPEGENLDKTRTPAIGWSGRDRG